MERPDVVVIGAGGGGPVIAKELAERGLKVLVLEAGPWLDPDVDFTRLEDDMGSIVDGRLRWGPADRLRSPWMRRRDGVGAHPAGRRRGWDDAALQRDLAPRVSVRDPRGLADVVRGAHPVLRARGGVPSRPPGRGRRRS